MSQTYEERKARYDALYKQSKARRRSFTEAIGNPSKIPTDLILREESLIGGWGWSGHVSRGQSLRLTLTAVAQGVSFLAFNAHENSERLNVGDTVKIQWSAALHKGKLLYSDMGRVLASMTDDTYGRHDALTGGSTPLSNYEKYQQAGLRSTRDNFILLAAKHGLSKIDIPPCVTFFAPVAVDNSGALQWQGPEAKAGDYIDLRAEQDLLVFLSNCPHPLSPGAYAPSSVHLTLWNAPVAADDFCRNASEEAIRGFENTDGFGLGEKK